MECGMYKLDYSDCVMLCGQHCLATLQTNGMHILTNDNFFKYYA
jgi:hypothetical protein